jgi:diacylglycerol kinase (ATP)
LVPSLFPLSPEAKRVLISVNPIAGLRSSAPRVDRLIQLLNAQGFQVDVLTDLCQVASQANRWQAAGHLRALVGVGGDGTAAELVNRTVPGVPLTMLPTGNENLLARYLRLGHTPEACCQAITAGATMRLDAAKAGDRIFLLMLGCGFDADVVHRLHSRRTGHVRSLTYIKPILAAVRNYEYPELRIEWGDGDHETGETLAARWLFAFNLPCYGGGLRICPRADGSDGLLDVCTFRRGNLWHTVRYAGAVLLRQHRRLSDFASHRARRLRITSDAEVRYQLDGDPGGVLPVEVETLPGRLTVLTPKPEQGIASC